MKEIGCCTINQLRNDYESGVSGHKVHEKFFHASTAIAQNMRLTNDK
jgi:hypothetical protein